MNYKVEYITRLFQKTSGKAIESYCLTRLWHRLDNDEIKFVPQQYVNRHIDKYALTDVYLPQFKIHIEVNEPAHYASTERIQADEYRKHQVETNTGHRLFVIDCRNDLLQIHKQIDNIVQVINTELLGQKKNGVFKPWQPDIERNPEFWKAKKNINEADDISFSSIEDICKLFDADFNKTKRGYLRLGGLPHPKNTNYLLWWPSEKARQGWLNELSADGLEITETHTNNTKRIKHFNDHLNSSQTRVVFFHYKDILGLTSYKFKGVYAYDNLKSTSAVGTVWKRVNDSLNIDLNGN
jgi:hypothetical protein